MRRIRIACLGMIVSTLAAGCASRPDAMPVCTAANSPESICGLMNPEDLGFLPGHDWILVSQMAQTSMDSDPALPPARPGNLLAVRVTDTHRKTLFPPSPDWVGEPTRASATTPGWGHANCPGPPSAAHFRPHGIDVGVHDSGASLLAVVNHGGREAVELFEIGRTEPPSLVWRGCVPMPEDMMANDVALLADGSFVVTKFAPPMHGFSGLWSGMKLLFGANTGSVYRWSPGGEVVPVAQSKGSAPNGIAVTPDGSEIFVAEWGGESLYRLRLEADGSIRRDSVRLAHKPDNLTWTRDGRLLAAGQAGSPLDVVGCGKIEKGGCGLGYGVYRIDPVSLQAERIIEGKGAASVALEVGDRIYVGVFFGDAIERLRVSD